jgi:hypothetical protein
MDTRLVGQRDDSERPGHTGSPHAEDIEIHHTRNTPMCATVVVLDMSGSMRYNAQYVNVNGWGWHFMASSDRYPGDFCSLWRCTRSPARHISELPGICPARDDDDPVVRLNADMSRPDISEFQIPPHFTNIQRGLQIARSFSRFRTRRTARSF